jgi:SAM-dependent methyltransferase
MDTIGQAIYNYYFNNDKEIISVESNYTEDEEINPAHFFRVWEEMPEIEQKALALCRGKVLDIGAGAGCHTLELQKNGLEVVALEKSELASQVMRDRGVINIVVKDIFHFYEKPFDTILLLMNGIGIAGSLSGLKKLLKHLKSILAPGGQIILDSTDISYLFEEEDGSVWFDLTNENYYGEMTYTVNYLDNNTSTFPWLFVDFETLLQIATEEGYKVELIDEGDDNQYLARLTIMK